MDTQKTTEIAVACDVKREKVRVIPIQFFDDFHKHPFYIRIPQYRGYNQGA